MTVPLLVERTRALLRVFGRDPVKMIHGLATADIAAVTPGQAAYTTFLTPKGRLVADARVFRRGAAETPELLLDTAPDAAEPLEAHFRRSIPPLFARAERVTEAWTVLGIYGVGSGAVVAEGLGGAAAAEEGPEERVVALDAEAARERGFAVRTHVTGEEGWDVFVPSAAREEALDALREAGARPGDPASLEALRIAAGRPRWGRELTADVIPLEAGLLNRAISQTKGCYTGQEVIVRILHRGHVNRHLRRLEFAAGAPAPGTELFEGDDPRPRGVVTSAVENDAGALGLGYVRREIEPPAELYAGSPDGPAVLVQSLD